jgi:hypothetical protein
MLRFYTKVPEKISPLAMWPLAMEGGGAGPNSSDPVPESAGEWEEDGLGLTTHRFEGLVGVEACPAAGFRGAIPCRPREPLLRRGRGHAGD